MQGKRNESAPDMDDDEDGEIIEDEMVEDSEELNIEAKSIYSEEDHDVKDVMHRSDHHEITAGRHQVTPTPMGSIGTGNGFKPARMQQHLNVHVTNANGSSQTSRPSTVNTSNPNYSKYHQK